MSETLVLGDEYNGMIESKGVRISKDIDANGDAVLKTLVKFNLIVSDFSFPDIQSFLPDLGQILGIKGFFPSEGELLSFEEIKYGSLAGLYQLSYRKKGDPTLFGDSASSTIGRIRIMKYKCQMVDGFIPKITFECEYPDGYGDAGALITASKSEIEFVLDNYFVA